MDAGNASIYAIGPIFSNISKGPHYLASNSGQHPNLIKLIFAMGRMFDTHSFKDTG